jgi:Ca2+/Na+ antiporter
MAWIWFLGKDNWVRKVILLLLGLIFIMTFSRTGAFSAIMVLALIFLAYLMRTLYKMKIKTRVNRSIRALGSIVLMICIVLGAFFWFIGGNNIYKVIRERTDLETVSSQRHFNYFGQGANAILGSVPRLLFGFGYRNGGRGLLETSSAINTLPGIQNIKIPWSPESDFVNNYLELGLFGFVSYLLIFMFGVFYLKEINLEVLRAFKNKTLDSFNYAVLKKKIFFFLACYGLLFFAGFTYVFKDNIWYWLLIISSVSLSLEFKKYVVKHYAEQQNNK